jgi:methanogenic corrinoid protein MtbC1
MTRAGQRAANQTDGGTVSTTRRVIDTGVPDLHGADLVTEFVGRCTGSDRGGAMLRTRELLRLGVTPRVMRAIVAGSQTAIGERWQEGRLAVAQEHAATAVAESVLAVLDDAVAAASVGRAPDRVGAVAVTAADGELHSLPVKLAEQAIRDADMDVLYLGAMMPASDLERSLPLLRVDAVAVSVTSAGNLDGARRTIAAVRDAGLPVMVGGQATTEARSRMLGATGHAADVETGAALLIDWLRDGPPSTPAPSTPDEVIALTTELRRLEPDLMAAAVAATGRRLPTLAVAPEQTHRWLADDLGGLLSHTISAALVDENDLLLDHVRWLTSVAVGRGLPTDFVPCELEALIEVLGDHPDAQAIVQTVREAALSG